MIRIISVGDIMPGGLLSGSEQVCAGEDVLEALSKGDIKCGTLECALGNEPSYDKEKVADRGNVIYAKDADVRRLKELDIDLVSLANNHFYDLGLEGAAHTIDLLDRNGIKHCGAGKNLAEAGAPVVFEIGEKTVAFLAFCDVVYKHVFMCTYATEDTPGINPMREGYYEEEIKKNALLYDYVVVLAHWGTENTYKPDVSTTRIARRMLNAGASLVLGSHPHRVQPIVNEKKGSIVYSMGNFLFPERLIAPPKVTYYSDEAIDYSTLPVTYAYPTVKRITLKSLPYLARVGMIVSSVLDGDTCESSFVLSYLEEDNRIVLLDNERSLKIRKSIGRIGRLVETRCFYGPYVFMSKCRNALAVRARSVMRHMR